MGNIPSFIYEYSQHRYFPSRIRIQQERSVSTHKRKVSPSKWIPQEQNNNSSNKINPSYSLANDSNEISKADIPPN